MTPNTKKRSTDFRICTSRDPGGCGLDTDAERCRCGAEQFRRAVGCVHVRQSDRSEPCDLRSARVRPIGRRRTGGIRCLCSGVGELR